MSNWLPDGERYHAQVPDTLDLADRMSLAINALTKAWNPKEKWAHSLDVDFSHRPEILYPSHVTDAYLNIPPKFIEALVLARLASGNTDNLQVDEAVLQQQLEFLGEDGLTYCPTDTLREFTEPRPFSEVWAEGRLLIALSMLAQVDHDPRWIAIGKRKVDRLLSLTRQKEDFRFLWKGRFRPGEEPPADADEPNKPMEDGSLARRDPVFNMIYSVGALGHGAGLFYRVSGYEPALELSGGLARWALARVFKNEDGRWNFWHFHHGLYALMAVCEYAYAANDRKMLERVDACYRWAREMGDPLIGYYTEHMPGSEIYLSQRGNTVETCEVADMVFLALYLTRAGIGDYWDDVDHWLRNVYAEAQMLDDEWVARMPESYLATQPNTRPHQDTDNIPARTVGSFFGWMRANDGVDVMQTPEGPKLGPRVVMHCCTGNGTRSLYHAWESIVTHTGDETQVNLLLNRASPWLDVDSYLPAAGKVVLKIKDSPRVVIRVPEWCDPAAVAITVGGQERSGLVNGHYLRLGWLKPGDEVVLSMLLQEKVVHRMIGEIPYKLTMRGANVVAIDPRGAVCPLYERQPSGQLVDKKRFIPAIHELIW
jgi:hypothetical protein